MRFPLLIAISCLLLQPAPPAATGALATPAIPTAPAGSHFGDSAAHLAALDLEPALAEMRRRNGRGVVRLAVLTIEFDAKGDGR